MLSVRSRRTALGLVVAASSLYASVASADPKLRFQRDLQGDVAVFGNTLAHDCGSTAALPADVTASCAGQVNTADTAPDIYWRDDVADGSVTPTQARTSATLKMPAGAKVVYARLYWAAVKDGVEPDKTAVLDWLGGPQVTINADDSWSIPTNLLSLPNSAYYQATGDATEFVSTWGAGDFRVSDVDGLPLAGLDLDRAFTAWTMVVFYEKPGDELRNLALFDGFTPLAPPQMGVLTTAEVTLQGFLVPPGYKAKMTAFTYEGDFKYGGDSFTINGAKAQDAQNPLSNFFNSSRSVLGVPDSGAADVPRLSGEPGSMSGYDLDTVDITANVKAGDTSAKIGAASEYDVFLLGGFVTSITNKAPNFAVTKTANDLNGGALLTEDEVEYVIDGSNNGNDPSVGTTVIDILDPELEFIPGSLRISGQVKTDKSGDDQAEYDAASRTITWRVGTGADAAKGGTVPVGSSFSVSFRAKVKAEKGAVGNQAITSASGESGGPKKEWLSDGDPQAVGNQQTVVVINECDTDNQCPADKPHCNTTTHVCEACKTDSDCTLPALPACQPDGSCGQCSANNASVCKGTKPLCNTTAGVCVTCLPKTANDPGDASQCQGNPNGNVCVVGPGNNNFCGCQKDSDCGNNTSGKVCDSNDTLVCIDGCRGIGGNGCGPGLICTSKDSSIGKCVSTPEDTDALCSDGKDNDGDGKVDCDDSDCKVASISACKENTDAKCKDGKDNDGDGQVDCADTDCKDNPSVTVCATEDTNDKCKDGKDNDNDGKIDCDDDGCKGEGITVCNSAENTDPLCSDGKDNDGNGFIDCKDPGCAGTAPCPVEDTDEECSNGKDDDNDGLIDCKDPSCKSSKVTICGDENTDAKCKDGKDNDGDDQVDCADPSCAAFCPTPENSDDKCKDGVDNDGDGKIDCADSDCLVAGVTVCGENTNDKCKDGVDNDGDGKVDCADDDCSMNASVTVCADTTGKGGAGGKPALGGDDGNAADAEQSGGCGCAVPGEPSAPRGALMSLLAGIGLLFARRRR